MAFAHEPSVAIPHELTREYLHRTRKAVGAASEKRVGIYPSLAVVNERPIANAVAFPIRHKGSSQWQLWSRLPNRSRPSPSGPGPGGLAGRGSGGLRD
jgi:hypothetical protein